MFDVREGDVLAGKYRIERVLGEGGMGVVVAALHLQLDERVAIKFLLPGALGSPEAVARFAREARAAVKIKSEHVARVSDVGTLETGAPYMVMELLQGRDLSVLVHDLGAVPFADAVEYVLQALEALAEAHALGIVHRDLKPANLFLASRADGSPCIKVLDFGISKLTSTSSSGADLGMTKTHAIMGSPLYMSPEQMSSSRNVDPRADIWAIGAILYELVTGKVPFEADTMPQLCGMILQELPRPLRTHRADIPEGLEQAILRCLEKDRTKRFQNVAELAVALAPYAPRNGARSAQRISKVLGAAGMSASVADHPASSPPAQATTQDTWGKTLSKSGGKAAWVVVAALLVAAGAGLAIWLRPGAAAPTASETPPAPPAPALAEKAPPAAVPAPAPVAAPVVPSEAPSAAAAAPTVATAAPADAAVARRRPPAAAAKPTVAPPSPGAAPARPSMDPLAGRQ